MRSQFRPAIVSFLLLTLITGVIYPAVVTGIAKLAFPKQAEGSMILRDGKPVGSELVGQNFTDAKYFWSRLSATSPNPYAADAGSGSNLGPSNPALIDAVKQRIASLHAVDPNNDAPIPIDLVTASASGLDPQISPAAAEYQIARVARARGVKIDDIRALVARCTEGRTLAVFGEPRVNVLQLNLLLDESSRTQK